MVMSFRTEWLLEPHILGTSFEQHCSLSELHLIMLEYLGAAQTQEVYFLLDFSQTNTPTGLLSLPSLLQVINHANTRLLVIVKPESSFSSMTQLLSRDKVKIMRQRKSAIDFLVAMVRLDSGEELSLNA
jgi:hypothetical protein